MEWIEINHHIFDFMSNVMIDAFRKRFTVTINSNSALQHPTGCFYQWINNKVYYSGIIMSAMASQITSLTIVCSTVYSGADKKKTAKLRVTGLSVVNSPITGEFPGQMASNTENVSIWWRHHVLKIVWWMIPCCTKKPTVKPVCNDHLHNKIYCLWFIQ